MFPADQGATERAGFAWVVLVLKIVAELLDPLPGKVRVVVAVELSDGFLGLPHGGHVASGITGAQQAEELFLARLTEAFFGLGQQAAAAVERIVFVTTVPHGLVLHPASALVELGVGQP